MKIPLSCALLCGLLLAGGVQAQTRPAHEPAQTIAPPPASAQNTLTTELPPQGFRTVTMQTPQGPVTVNWGQSGTLSNAADYRATIEQLDANGDGVITLDEVPETHALHSEFRLVDSNHDGRITAQELAQWH